MRERLLKWIVTLAAFFGVPLLVVWLVMPLLDISHATYLSAQGDYQAALNTLNRAISFNGGLAGAYTRRGFVLDKLGQYERALSDFNKAIELSPNSWEPYNNRAMTQAQMPAGELKHALDDANRAISLGYDQAPAYDTRGYLELKGAQTEAALADFSRAIELNSRFGEAYYHRALCFEELKQLDKARSDRLRAHEFGYYGEAL